MTNRSPKVTEMLGIQHPIFGFTHSVDVCVEVTKAGGVGILGATRSTPEEIRRDLAEIRRRVGNLPFGVDLVLPKGMPERNNREEIEAQLPSEQRAFVEHIIEKYHVPPARQAGMRSRFVRSEEVATRQIDVVLQSDVDIFACGIGSPEAAIREAKAGGKTVISLIGSPKHARVAIASGVDIIVAQGFDAGAHTGTIGTFSLVPQIVDIAGDIPVLAAGGVASGRHIAAALAMGAAGVWIGTAWLVTKESHTHPVVLKKLLAAGSDDTVISRADSGKTLRQIRTAWSDEWAADDAPKALKMPFQDILVGDLLGAIDQHGVEPLMHSPAGQGIAMFNQETTTAAVMANLVAETEAALATLATRQLR